ncbi:ASC1-like protein 3 [Capsicum chinense]|nr:ASC1-like protein 3 [Capsicum chinense]
MSINLWLFSPNSQPQGERLNLYPGGATRIVGELAIGVCSHCGDPVSLIVLNGIKLIYMCQCGFYLYSIVAFLVWETQRKDFGVMMSHHIVIVILISFSYISSFFRIRIVILALHDASDVFMEAAKLFKYLWKKIGASVLFGCFAVSWLAHKDLSPETVHKSLVLLKNEEDPKKSFLPLDKTAKKILVTGTHADDLGYQCGGWTATWTGLSGRITVASVGLAALLVPHNTVLRVVPNLIIEGPAIQPGHWAFNSALKAFGSNIIFTNGLLDRWSGGSVLKDVAETIAALITEKGVQNEERDEENDEDIDLTGEDFWVVDKCFNINSFVLNFLKLIVT